MIEIRTSDVERALEALQRGEVIVFPTETSYGIGCDATNVEAVARVFLIKGRPDSKGTPLIIPNVQSAKDYVIMSERALELANEYWPGPLNIIAPIAENSPVAKQCSQDNTQSVRVSSHPFCAILAQRFGKPIVASSANISGQDAAYSIEQVREAFMDKQDAPDLIIDGGVLPPAPPSTTVKVQGDEVSVIRQGSITL